jgi:lincosamide and streptogramin A transport system ATP-binding/permease protein
MSNILIRGVEFSYPGSHYIFSNLDLTLSSDWRVALVGRNGRGKTTLLRLLAGELQAARGSIDHCLRMHRFPAWPDAGATAFQAALDAAGPYRVLEERLQNFLAREDMDAYAVLQARYQAMGGYTIEAQVARELARLEIDEGLWDRPLHTLSGGEQTRCLLAGAFAGDDGFALLDEPTDHLDRDGREHVARYLAGKRGFVLVSHDRAFLDASTDHVLALNTDTVELQRSTFSAWRQGYLQRLDGQRQRNAWLRGEAARLEANARMRRAGAEAREAEKAPHSDRGYTGARAARQMKRAIASERRMLAAAEQRRDTMVDVEREYALRFPTPVGRSQRLLHAAALVAVRDQPLFEPLSFDLQRGERLLVRGPNGCGKSSLLDTIAGVLAGHDGLLVRAPGLVVSRVRQQPLWRRGALRDHLARMGLEESAFRQIMAALGVRGPVLDGPLETLSAGQLRKVELARSLCRPADLYLWDEPLNHLDMQTREGLEAAILRDRPTMLLVEHDAAFASRIATREIVLSRRP